MNNITYLALPYTDPCQDTRQIRYDLASKVTAVLTKKGFTILSPIVQYHPIAETYDLPYDWEFWKRICSNLLLACHNMIVLTIPGWRESTGTTEEIKIAENNNIPTEYKSYVDICYPSLKTVLKDKGESSVIKSLEELEVSPVCFGKLDKIISTLLEFDLGSFLLGQLNDKGVYVDFGDEERELLIVLPQDGNEVCFSATRMKLHPYVGMPKDKKNGIIDPCYLKQGVENIVWWTLNESALDCGILDLNISSNKKDE